MQHRVRGLGELLGLPQQSGDSGQPGHLQRQGPGPLSSSISFLGQQLALEPALERSSHLPLG